MFLVLCRGGHMTLVSGLGGVPGLVFDYHTISFHSGGGLQKSCRAVLIKACVMHHVLSGTVEPDQCV